MGFSLRALQQMAKSRETADWWHTAAILAKIHSLTAKPERVSEFHPLLKKTNKEEAALTPQENSQMWDCIVGGNSMVSM